MPANIAPMTSPASLPRAPVALAPALRAALHGAAGRAAVLLQACPAMRLPRRRRMAETLLDDAARVGGGDVYRTTGGEALLFGTAPTAVARVATGLGSLAGDMLAISIWHLPRD